VLETFRAVEERDLERLLALYHPDVELCWPPSLPYGGTSRGLERLGSGGATWDQTWDPRQPTDAERQMDPRVVATQDDDVVVLYHQRGRSPAGRQLDQEVLGWYRVADGKFARAQMFYFDTVALVDFLSSP
jgi:ketosteroid isomerase-like protein